MASQPNTEMHLKDNMDEKKFDRGEVIAAIVASIATIVLIYSRLLQTYAGHIVNQVVFLLTFPAVAFSLILGGDIHNASHGSYIFALFVEFLLIWWLFIHVARKVIAGRKRSSLH